MMRSRKRAKKLRPVSTIAKAIEKANQSLATIEETLNRHTPFHAFANAARRLVKFRAELDSIADPPFSFGLAPNVERRLSHAQTYVDLFDLIYIPLTDFCSLHVDPSDQIQDAEREYASVFEDWKSGKIKKGLLEYVFNPTEQTPDRVRFKSEHIVRVRDYAEKALPLIGPYLPYHRCLVRFATDNLVSTQQISALKEKIYLLNKELESARQFERQHGNTLAITARAKSQTRSRVSDLQHLVERTQACPYCANTIVGTPHLDHIHPVSCGGLSVLENLVWACQRCNGLKSNKTVLEFCEASSLDLSEVIFRLRSLGKRV